MKHNRFEQKIAYLSKIGIHIREAKPETHSEEHAYRIEGELNKMVQNTKSRGQNFIRVYLCSGTSANPLGSEELAIFCQCGAQEPSVAEVKIEDLIQWVNSNPKCKKNQSNEKYKISKQLDAMEVVILADREIQACHLANRIFPCLVAGDRCADVYNHLVKTQ